MGDEHKLKTVTLGPEDGPVYTICKGHLTLEAFCKAFLEEGWSAEPAIEEDDLSHEYWIDKGDYWLVSNVHNQNAEPVTVMDW